MPNRSQAPSSASRGKAYRLPFILFFASGLFSCGLSPVLDGPAPLKNTLKWSTASEVNNFGYDVYRAGKKDGPFQRLTKQPIIGQDTTDLPSHYEFVDDTIEAGTPYFYYVESISMDGKRMRFTPVIAAPAKTHARYPD